ncbi:MAG: dehydrogenase [Chthoniobacterales bacterium]|nr:dehydrogenase [Chthoniobacterales bacterium]
MKNKKSTPPAPAKEFAGLNREQLLDLYRSMSLLRIFEAEAQKAYRAGEMPGFIHLYIGEEATGVGVCAHLRADDWITSTHRGHGHALAKGVSPREVMAELYGRATGCCGGRGGTMHLYQPKVGLFGTNGFVGGGIPSAVGVGMSAKKRGTDQVSVAFFGDGAVQHATFHESINLAGIQRAPVVFVCENNLYGTATALSDVTANVEIATKAAAYGIPGIAVDGNDVIAVYEAMREAVTRARSGQGPTLIEAKTYRVVGHHEGDPLVGTYRNQEEIDDWLARCPLKTFRDRLIAAGLAQAEDFDRIDADISQIVADAVDFARKSPEPDPATALDHSWADPINPPIPATPTETVVEGWLNAVRDGIAEEMRRDPHIVYLGEGTALRGGTFGHTKNLYEEFGPARMMDMPISELGYTGASIGLSVTGARTICDLMMGDFLFEAGSQIVHQAGKLRYMSNGQISVPVVIRTMHGAMKNTGPHHSGNYQTVWGHCPGLIVVAPSNPGDAKGLFKTALRASDPVIFLEHKMLLSTKGPVPKGEYLIPFGQARVAREGKDITVVAAGQSVIQCLQAAEILGKQGISCEVIDLRTIVPLDIDTIIASVSKTGHLFIADEGFSMFGLGAEIAQQVVESAFDELDAPVGRCHTEPVAIPFSPALERAALLNVERIADAIKATREGRPPVPTRLALNLANKTRPAKPARPPEATGAQPAVEAAAPTPAPPVTAAKAPANGIPVTIPNMDLTVTEARIVAWLKNVGDPVELGEPILQVETDKAVVDVESPASGRLATILVQVDSVAQLKEQVAIIEPA